MGTKGGRRRELEWSKEEGGTRLEGAGLRGEKGRGEGREVWLQGEVQGRGL